ncbi:hypothetical protein PCL_12588 [Purpureocillium lilacinum]|uniref:Uncharacterized protein n=1 Tax=Purpureocillium lilacinum TaxID=33203 RepID=A0A2U3E9Q4_PURLI|nr:hypothetical protein PCL_12588 [Purpureocillium lilacinum]
MSSLRTREGDGPAQLSRPLCKRGVVSSSEFHLYEAQRPDAVLHAALVSRLTDEMARAVTTPRRQKQGHGKTKKYRGYSKTAIIEAQDTVTVPVLHRFRHCPLAHLEHRLRTVRAQTNSADCVASGSA